MVTTQPALLHSLQNLFLCLFKKTRNLPFQILSRCLKVVAYLISKLCIWRKVIVEDDRKPSLKIDGPDKTVAQSNLGTVDYLEGKSGIEPQECVEQSDYSWHETISLDPDVAYSFFPYASGGIPNASRSSQNLRKSLKAHDSRNSVGLQQSTTGLGHTASLDPASETAPTIAIRRPTLPNPPMKTIRVSSSGLDRILLPDQNAIELEPITSGSPQEINPDMLVATDRPSFARPSSSYTSSVSSPPSSRSSSPSLGNARNLDESGAYASHAIQLNNDRIVPSMPESTLRYDDKPRIKDESVDVTLPSMTTDYSKPLPPSDWTRLIHPEGARYFSKQSTSLASMTIWTESDILNNKILERLEDDILTIEQFILDKRVHIPAHSDLIVNVHDERTVYYFANHPTRTIFLLDDYKAENLDAWSEVTGAQSLCHIRYAIEHQYWFFILLFPHALNVTKSTVQDLRGTVLHFIGDSTTSPTSNAPYSLDDLYKVLTLVDHLDENANINNAGAASLLGRLMFVFAKERFLNFHGEPHSRLERTFSVYGNATHPRRWLVKTLAPLLFYAPEVHLITLQNMWVDQIMHKAVFESLVQKMNDEWQQFVLFATVVLNANVAFLAIQSVDNNDSNDPHRLPAQICSYLSIVASVGSILLGLLLVREFKTKDREAISEIQNYLFSRTSSSMGLEVLAILFSLPYALLMWGMIAFVAGFASLCFQTSDLSTRTIVGSSFLVVAALLILCIQTNWDKRKPSQLHPNDGPLETSEDRISVQGSKFSIKTNSRSSVRLPSLSLHRSSPPQTLVGPFSHA